LQASTKLNRSETVFVRKKNSYSTIIPKQKAFILELSLLTNSKIFRIKFRRSVKQSLD